MKARHDTSFGLHQNFPRNAQIPTTLQVLELYREYQQIQYIRCGFDERDTITKTTYQRCNNATQFAYR